MENYVSSSFKKLKSVGKPKPKLVSLFSGCGGLDYTFHKAGYELVWANDFNLNATKTFARNISKKITTTSIKEVNLLSLPKADIVLGGFPCQDFSQIWKKPGLNGTRGNLYSYFVETVSVTKPKIFIAENVKGLLSANGGMAIKTIIDDFKKIEPEYLVLPKLVNFANYGLPQIRERVLIIGLRIDTAFDMLMPKFDYTKELGNFVSAGTALEGIPLEIPNQEHMNIKQKTINMLSKIPAGGNFTDIPKDDPDYVKGMISHVYRRIHPDEPSKTIISAGGGGTWGYHFPEPRALTNRERARIQGFPDDFTFEGSFGEVRKQIGNAVSPIGIIPFCNEFTNFFKGSYKKTDLKAIAHSISNESVKRLISKLSLSNGINLSSIFSQSFVLFAVYLYL